LSSVIVAGGVVSVGAAARLGELDERLAEHGLRDRARHIRSRVRK
jgi:hypothetical protein